MRRVCVFCENWESGGIEAFLTNVICSMDRTGLVIDIVAAKLGQSVFTASLQELGVGFFQLSGSIHRVRENRKRFRALLQERNYDVVHLNVYQAYSLAYLRLTKEAGTPVRIAHSHNTALRKSVTRPLKLVLHQWARGEYKGEMTCRWACSEAAAKFLFGEAEEYTFIPNGIDVERFRFDFAERKKVRKELGVKGKRVIGNVGRFCYQKNQEFLLDMFKEIIALSPSSVLLLIGEGEDRLKLTEKAEILGIKDSVIFYGTTDKVERLYWAMDVFVFPSRFEGLGIAGVEAQAAGLPVICSEHIPQEALVTDQVTQLPLSAGAREWAAAVVKAESPPNRMSATEKVSDAGYAVESVASRIRETWMG